MQKKQSVELAKTETEGTREQKSDESGTEKTSESEEENHDDGGDDIIPDEERIEEMDKLNFDFEAFPPSDEDSNDIEGLLTQIFLRSDIDFKGLARAIIEQAPMGCVYKPAEEFLDNDDEDEMVYGLLTIVGLSGKENFQKNIAEFIVQKARKYATSDACKKFEGILNQSGTDSKIGLLINERLLHFPAQISGPGFTSLRDEYNSLPRNKQFNYFLAVLKIRICCDNDAIEKTSASKINDEQQKQNGQNKKRNKKRGKAEKKRQLAARLATAATIYDNSEEQALFTTGHVDFPFFQYPVETEIDGASKFNSIRRDGRIYRPYRRVCLLSEEQFLHFSDMIVAQNSTL